MPTAMHGENETEKPKGVILFCPFIIFLEYKLKFVFASYSMKWFTCHFFLRPLTVALDVFLMKTRCNDISETSITLSNMRNLDK